MFLTKLLSGLFKPTYPSDHTESSKVKEGEEVRATKARNVKFHRLGFSLLQLGFQNQSKYDNFDIWRQVVTMKAGFVHFIKGVDGVEYPLPHSLSFDKMNAEEFERWYAAIKVVIAAECKISGTQIDEEINNFF